MKIFKQVSSTSLINSALAVVTHTDQQLILSVNAPVSSRWVSYHLPPEVPTNQSGPVTHSPPFTRKGVKYSKSWSERRGYLAF